MKMMLGDRLKVLVLIALFLCCRRPTSTPKIPIMSFWEALQDQLRAKWWLVGLFGLEVLRQLHYLICERSAGYNQFWEKHVWGAWDRRMDKVNPWRRYRLNRIFKFVVFTIIAGLIWPGSGASRSGRPSPRRPGASSTSSSSTRSSACRCSSR